MYKFPDINRYSCKKSFLFFCCFLLSTIAVAREQFPGSMHAAAFTSQAAVGDVSFVRENGGALNLSYGYIGINDTCLNEDGCSIEFFTQDGSAKAGVDYVASSGTLSWNSGEGGGRQIRIEMIDNSVNDGDKSFTIGFRNAIGIEPEAGIAITVKDDEALVGPSNVNSQPETEISRVIEGVCSQVQDTGSNFKRDCDALLNAEADDYANALTQITPFAANAPADVSQNSVSVQARNIGARLLALRRGARSSIDGLSFNFNGMRLAANDLIEPSYGTDGGSMGLGGSDFGQFGVFVNGELGLGNKDSTDNEDGFSFRTMGITAGADYRWSDNIVFGVAFGFSSASTEINQNGGKLDSSGLIMSVFGSFYSGTNIFLDGSISLGRTGYDQERNIRYTLGGGTSVNQTAFSEFDGDEIALTIGGGYEIFRGPLTLIPAVRLEYITTELDDYREDKVSHPGAAGSGWAIEVDGQEYNSLVTALGGQAIYVMNQSWGVLTPTAGFEWVHEFEDSDGAVTGRFLGDPAGGTFRLNTDKADSDYFNLSVGATAVLAGGRSGFISYKKALDFRELTHDAFNVGVRMEF